MAAHAPLLWLTLAAFLVLTLGLYAWGAWVVRRHGTVLFRLAARGILVGAVLSLVGAGLAMDLLSRASAPAPGASQGAEAYAQSVSQAFALAALPVGLGNLMLLASVVVLAIGSVRRSAS